MIKFVGDKDGSPVIGLGLSRQNIQKLKDGKPIVVDMGALGLPPGEILIFYGNTEAAMTKQLLPYISEETIVHGTETLERG